MKNLNEVAKELNEVMGLTPPIKTVAVKKEVLLAGIKEAAEQIDPEQDEFTDETIEALKELNLWPGKEEEEEEVVEEKPKPKASKVKPEPEEDDEPEIAVDKKPKKKSNLIKSGEKTEFGHITDSQAGKIDLCLIKNKGKKVSVEDLAKAAGTNNGRVKSHILHLTGKKKVVIKVEEDKETKTLHYLYK